MVDSTTAIQTLCSSPVACFDGDGMFTDWFDAPFGVEQQAAFFPTLFALFVNEFN